MATLSATAPELIAFPPPVEAARPWDVMAIGLPGTPRTGRGRTRAPAIKKRARGAFFASRAAGLLRLYSSKMPK